MAEEYEDDCIILEDVVCRRDTGQALYCEIDGKMKWIPQSLVHSDSEVYKKGTEGNLIIPRWFAEQEKLV